MIYFVVGPSGVGKTCFSQTIQKQYGIPIYDTGPILRHKYKELKINVSFSEWIEDNEKKHGDNFAISVICDDIKEIRLESSAIIIGNRCIDGINYMIDYFRLKHYCIIYLDASYNCLKLNYENREKRIVTDIEFQKVIDGGNQMGLPILKEYVLENLDKNCFYYYKKSNDELSYIDIFDEISKHQVKRRKK